MKRRITALLTVLVMMLLWTVQPSSAAAAATSGSDAAGSGTEKSAQTVLNELSDEGCPVYLSPVAAPNAMVDASPEGVLQLWSLRVGKTHSWFLDKVDTHYLIKDAVTGMVIEVEGGTAKNNARLRLGVQRKSDDQLWSITPVPGEQRYTIASKLDPSFVMDDAAAKSDNGNPVILFKGDGKSPNQKFTITRAVTETLVDDFQRYGTDENYKFVPLHAGHMVVDLNGGGNQSYVHLWTAVHTGDQEISMHKLENSDYYYFEHPVSHKVVSIANGNVWGGVGLAMTGYTGDDWQLWRLEPLGDGTYVIHSKANDDLVWDCHNQGTYNDTRVEVYPVNKLSHQRFRISHATTVEPVSEWGAHLKSTQSQSWSLWDGDDTYTGWYWNHEYDSDFYVSTASEFAGISYLVRHGHQFFEGRTIHLTCDINLAGIEWIKIGSLSNPFMGHLNGHGHTITGLSMTKSAEADDYIGLFGRIYKGSVSNLAVKGKVCGDEFVGGIVGYIDCGQLYNVYSEVTITKGTYRYLGGICGYAGSQTYIEHCTQNAMVNSGDQDSYRGGIAGAFDGVMRYNTNLNTVYCNWNWVGGIMGCGTNMIAEYCANYGTVGGGGYAERVGGICGEVFGDCIIYACCNEGEVYSLGDDWVGGICGKATNWFRTVHGCINAGWISGDHCIGGIIGEGRASSCLNVGKVTGSTKLGAISGKAPSADSCVALYGTSPAIVGDGSRSDAYWADADTLRSGKACWDLNDGDGTIYMYTEMTGNFRSGIKTIFTQNFGSDPMPTFGSAKVIQKNGGYTNDGYTVQAEYDHLYGTVIGTGTYQSGKVEIQAIPANGCVFDYLEIITVGTEDWVGYDGVTRPYPTAISEKKESSKITLTENINSSYKVRAHFRVNDHVPPGMSVNVTVKLTCVEYVNGWNSASIPVYLVDSAGEEHLWNVPKDSLNTNEDSVTKDFYLGAASPVGIKVYPDFGGGLTFHTYKVKASVTVQGVGAETESPVVTIRSWPFMSSRFGDDYMNITFDGHGNAAVGTLNPPLTRDSTGIKGNIYQVDEKGNFKLDSNKQKIRNETVTNTVHSEMCITAWERALSLGDNAVIRLSGAWLLDQVLEINSGTVTIDLNGYPIIRTLKKTQRNGECFKIGPGATLNIIDSSDFRRSASTFSGGSIQGGRSDNTGGIIECSGTLNMRGGTLYNGGTTDKGGAIKLNGNGKANLDGVLIADCWADMAWFSQNEGGAIYMRNSATATLKNCTIRNCKALDYGGGIYMEDDGNSLTCENVTMTACVAEENFGGAVHQDRGGTTWVGGVIKKCRANDDDGGAFYQDDGEAFFRDIAFESNYSDGSGGVLYCNTDDKTWFINCTMNGNSAKNYGGAVYMNKDYFYVEDCRITGNSAGSQGGGVWVNDIGSIDVCGVVVIDNNSGAGDYDNLIMDDGAYFYDHGLRHGSKIKMRSDTTGTISLSEDSISEFKLGKYIFGDNCELILDEMQLRSTKLSASVFTDGSTVLYVGAAIILLFLTGGLLYAGKRRRGGKQHEK